MSSTTLRVPARPIGLYRPLWSRAWSSLAGAWSAWRAAARRRAEWRSLAALDARILKDVGLGEFAGEPADAAAWKLVEHARRW